MIIDRGFGESIVFFRVSCERWERDAPILFMSEGRRWSFRLVASLA
jgi:hypothetical protein